MTLSKWDRRFIDLAKHVSQWSKDDSTRVGAVIVDNKNRVVSLGFNGFPRGVDDKHHNREHKLLKTLHAEDNALSFANKSTDGCTIYITHPPCSSCAARLIQHGIVRVVHPEPIAEFLSRWEKSCLVALEMFNDAGVEVVYEGKTQ